MRIAAALVAVALAASACGSGSGTAGAHATVVGRVLSAPSCPVERVGVPCPPRRVPGASVVALRSRHVVASTRTDASGRFRLSLSPGRYVIRATNIGGLATTAEKTVRLRAGQTTSVTLVVDSGIR